MRAAAVGLCSLWAGLAAWAHEPGADALPDTPGWRLGVAAALVLPQADERWPTAGWAGVLVDGTAPPDQRHGLRLEHGTLGLATRFAPVAGWQPGVHLAWGWHDRDSAHVEAALVELRRPWGADQLTLGLGRDTVRLRGVIDGAGHFDHFSTPPLAQRAVLNGQWLDTGAWARWQRDGADGVRAAELGLWRGNDFPGGPGGGVAPSAHLHLGWGHWDAHLGGAALRTDGRGTALQRVGSTGHLHGSLDCRSTLAQRVCFQGRVQVLAASLAWASDDETWSLAAAGLARRDDGQLFSTNGDTRYTGTHVGHWWDLRWRPATAALSGWELALRLERLVPEHRLVGIGAAAVARDAGLEGAAPVHRQTLALAYNAAAWGRWSLEAGQEKTCSGAAQRFLALRWVWRQANLLEGRF